MKKINNFVLSSLLAVAAIPSLFSQSYSDQYKQQEQTYRSNQGQSVNSSIQQSAPISQIPSRNSKGNSQYQLSWITNFKEALAKSQSTGQPIVMLFTGTNWCPACMKLEKEVLTKPEFAQALGNQFVFFKAEFPDYGEDAIMSSPYSTLLQQYDINAFPTLIVINASGKQLYTVNYQAGGPAIYINELLQKLNSVQLSESKNIQPLNPSNNYYQ
jgi:thioredoxin-related protein